MKLPLIIAITALLLLAACGNNGEITAETQGTSFGAVLPLTGPNAWLGEFSRYGIDLAVEDINKAGGVNGQPVTVVYEDSGGEKARATTAAQKLADIDQVKGIVTITTPMGGAIAPVAEAAHVPFIYASATNSFAENKTYVFKDYPDATDLCALLMRQALKSGNQKVALFGTNAEFTIFCKEGAEKVAPLAAYDTYDSGETDFRAHLTKLKSSGSTALIMSAFASDCLNMFKQMRELRFTPQVFSPYQSFACGNTENVRANADMLVKAYGSDIALYENRTDEQFVSFRKRLEEHGWTAHIGGSALMYDTVMELAKAWSGCQDADCAAKNLRQLNYQGVSGMISYGGDQIVSREVMLTTFENGVWKRVE